MWRRGIVKHDNRANLLSSSFPLNQKRSPCSRDGAAAIISHLDRRNSVTFELFGQVISGDHGMSSHKARVFRHRAEEFRELALSMAPSERQAMLLTADDYERIAARVEKDRQQVDRPSNAHMFD